MTAVTEAAVDGSAPTQDELPEFAKTRRPLPNVKDIVKKVEAGLECGIGADPEWDGFKAGDELECLDLVDKIQTLETASEILAERVEEYQAGEAEREAAREKAKEGYQRQQRRAAPSK